MQCYPAVNFARLICVSSNMAHWIHTRNTPILGVVPEIMRNLTTLTQRLNTVVRFLNRDIRDLWKEGRLVDEAFLQELTTSLSRTALDRGMVEAIVSHVRFAYGARVAGHEEILKTVRAVLSGGSSGEFRGHHT